MIHASSSLPRNWIIYVIFKQLKKLNICYLNLQKITHKLVIKPIKKQFLILTEADSTETMPWRFTRTLTLTLDFSLRAT